MNPNALGVVASLAAFAVILELLRRKRLRERHALLWLLGSLLSLVVSIFPQTLTALSKVTGVEVPTNLVFFASIIILFFVSLQLSSELTKAEDETRTIIEELSILEAKINELGKNKENG